MLERQGKYEEAEAMHRQALRGYEKVLGPEHPDTLTSVNNIGLVLERQGNPTTQLVWLIKPNVEYSSLSVKRRRIF